MPARLWLLLVITLLSASLLAEDDIPPSLELLEFLGSWEDAQGNWVDPQLLELAAKADEHTENETGNEQQSD